MDNPAATPPSDGGGELPEYRELSPAAVVALVMGVVSPVALLAEALVVAPVGALAVGLLALRGIAADPLGRSGRPLAVLGVGLAVATLAAIGSRRVAGNWMATARATPVAEAWLERVREGDLRGATLLSTPIGPAAPGEAPPPLQKRWPVVDRLLALQQWTAERAAGGDVHSRGRGQRWTVDQLYEVRSDAAPAPLLLRVQVIQGSRRPSGPGGWLVSQVAAIDGREGR